MLRLRHVHQEMAVLGKLHLLQVRQRPMQVVVEGVMQVALLQLLALVVLVVEEMAQAALAVGTQQHKAEL
jgi:hypothetical protein